MLSQYWNKLKWLISGPSRTARKNPQKGPHSNVFPLEIPLEPDLGKGWKPYPIFKRFLKGKYSLKAHASVLVPGCCPHPPHKHDEEEILIMLAGEAELLLPENGPENPVGRRRVETGDFVYYPAGFPHSIEAVGTVPANYLMFKWSAEPVNNAEPLDHLYFKEILSLPVGYSEEKLSRKRLFGGPTAFLHKLHCHLSYLPPGKGYPAHHDPYDVAIVVLEGEVETLNAIAKPHDVILYAAGELHGMHNPGQAVAIYLVFEFHFDKPIRRKK